MTTYWCVSLNYRIVRETLGFFLCFPFFFFNLMESPSSTLSAMGKLSRSI